jgi:hypothetical protein
MTLEIRKKKTDIKKSGLTNDVDSDLFNIKDATDPTKTITFDLSGITTGTERTITIPDRDFTGGELSTDPSPVLAADLDAAGYYATDLQNTQDTLATEPKYLFDGTNDAAVVADNASLDVGTGDFYIAMAINPYDVTRETDYIINKEAAGIGYGLYLNEDDLYIRLDDDTADASAIIGSGVFSNNTEAIVVVSFDRSGNATAYINGASVGTVDISGSALTLDNAGDLHIGNDSAGTNEFYGEIRLCAIGNKTLTATEAKRISNGLTTSYEYAGASQTELMPNQVDRDFSGASAWANVDFNSYDETDDLTVTATAAEQYATLLAASAPTTIGKRYRMTFDVANIVSTFTIQSFDGTQEIGTVSADGTTQNLDWTATTTGGYRIVADADDSSADFDNFTLTQLGCVFEVDSSGVGHNTWEDINGNELHADVSGAIPFNLPANHTEKYINLGITDDVTFTLPKDYIIDAIAIKSSGAIGGGIDIGTTDGGGEIVTAETISGAGTVLATLVAAANYNTTGADDTIYISDADGTGWDGATAGIVVKMSKVGLS